MDRKSALPRARGLTLIEMLVVMLVAALALAAAGPVMTDVFHRARVGAESVRLLSAINLARSEAVLRGSPVTLCPSPVARTGEAACAGAYAGGWMIFANADRDREVDAGSDEVLHVFSGVSRGFSVRNSAGTRAAERAVNFLPDGTSRSNQTLRVCPPDGSQVAPRSVVLSIAGRARLEEGGEPCAGA